MQETSLPAELVTAKQAFVAEAQWRVEKDVLRPLPLLDDQYASSTAGGVFRHSEKLAHERRQRLIAREVGRFGLRVCRTFRDAIEDEHPFREQPRELARELLRFPGIVE